MPDRLGDQFRVRHILDAISKIEDYTKGINFERFSENSMMKDACLRQLSIIGEACNRISEDTKTNHPKIEWRPIIGLRNIVIHQYFGVDLHIVWDIIEIELPKLKEQMRQLI